MCEEISFVKSVKEKKTTVKYNYEHFVQYLKVTAWQIAFAHQSVEGIDGI